MDINRIKLKKCWKDILASEFSAPHMVDLKKFLVGEYKKGKKIFPPSDKYFEALNLTGFSEVKVVLLGQDPYHNDGQAHGLCFSVKPGVPPPPSLKNIYKELHNDLGIETPNHGYLKSWANEGVLMLNSTLTVEKDQAGSHQKKGWEPFTDAIIRHLNEKRSGIVFILWGAYAQKKGAFIDTKKHLVLKSPHPSPLGAHRGFFGNHHFSKANEYLKKYNQKPVNWTLPL